MLGASATRKIVLCLPLSSKHCKTARAPGIAAKLMSDHAEQYYFRHMVKPLRNWSAVGMWTGAGGLIDRPRLRTSQKDYMCTTN